MITIIYFLGVFAFGWWGFSWLILLLTMAVDSASINQTQQA